LTLIGANTHSGGTTISAGTLQVGNGGTSGSIIGNVVDNGTLSFNRSNTLSFGGVISGTGSLEQNGSGSTILSGINSYTGGTIVNAGTLTVNSAQALGLGNVVVNGGILRADPQPINVKGN
jgi:fibronectin-binding autotransporter adhesin